MLLLGPHALLGCARLLPGFRPEGTPVCLEEMQLPHAPKDLWAVERMLDLSVWSLARGVYALAASALDQGRSAA